LVKNKINIIFANEQEILSLTNAKSLNEAIDFAKKINKKIIITRGDKGAISVSNNEVSECQANNNLNIIDLTGAGDLFASGYLHGYINNFSEKDCLLKATEMSSKIIQKIGARI